MPNSNTNNLTPTVQTLSFGVEVETGIPRQSNINIGSYHGAASNLPNFPEQGTVGGTKWKAASDSSISVNGMTGCEFVSPILRGIEGLNNLEQAVDQIKALGAKVNTTTGVHVHVEFPSNDLAALRRLIHLVSHWEAALFATTGTKHREQSSYCASIKSSTNRAARFTCRESMRNTFSNRYRILNVTPLLSGRQPTVEFRCFSGSTNSKKIVAWTMLCLSLVEAALAGSRAKAWDMPESSVTRERGEGRGELLVKALLNDLWVWNGKSRTAGQFGHTTFDHAFARKQLVRMARRYDFAEVEVDA